MVESNDLSVTKEYMDSMEKSMNTWFSMMHDLYLKISTILMSFALAAIGFLLSYLLGNEYHCGKYETCIDMAALICLFGSLVSLMGSVACGFTHLCKNLAFIQCTGNYFKERYIDAVNMYYKSSSEEPPEEKEYTNECKNPSPWWWRSQILTFSLGAIFLISLITIDFFTVG